RKELVRYGGIALAVLGLIVGYSVYSRHEHSVKEAELAKAIQVQEAPVGPPTPGTNLNFPTEGSKSQVALQTFRTLAAKYPGSDEGVIAQYYVGAILADQGKLAEAEKSFKEAADRGSEKYASNAKLSLAQIYFADGRDQEGERVLRELISNPTLFVSKEQ